MASALINNTVQVFFDSVLGCSSALFEADLVEFFHNDSVRYGMVVSMIQGKPVSISEELFFDTFELPLEGLTDLQEVPQDLVLEAMRAFSYDGKLLSTSCKKKDMVSEFRLLNDILAKSMIVKAGLLCNIFKDMVTQATRQARVYAVQICVLLKNAPALELGESKEFPPLKILTAKTVGTYIAKNKNIYVDGDEPVVEKPAEKNKAMPKKRPAPTVGTPVAKTKRTTGRGTPADTILALVTLAQEAVPIQMVSAVTPPAPKRKAPKRKLQLPVGSDDEIVEKKLAMESVVEQQREQTTADEVDKIIDQIITETTQMETDMEGPSFSRSGDIIVEITACPTAVTDEDDILDGAENESSRKMASSFTAPKQVLRDPLRSGEDDDMSGLKQPSKIIERRSDISNTAEYFVEEPLETEDHGKEIEAVATSVEGKMLDDESLSIDDPLAIISADALLPSVTAAEITRIQFEHSIEIREVEEGDWYKARLPIIPAETKGKAPLQEIDTIKGHPAREIFTLIFIDIDFLVQIRAKVIDEVAKFFNYFSLRRLAVLGSTTDTAAKEERVLTWAETDSVQIALQRREFITTKYRELLLLKFLETRRHNFASGQHHSAIDLQVLDMLSDVHLSVLEEFQK
ncbi:splicing factor 3B subunit 1-like [Dorcoceras hygrometricum]|uniref:Splicing factor 3B subunit 1-like n=1 Tax=Dorcoceras hygrometricum TaxID=472368 RepID=A0A2Z7D830_9LAMI|nr:splicing factor 3B subunit 1-like [Dorcoceras hygrometricum]